MGEADVELYVLVSTVDTDVILLLETCASEEFILIVVALYRLPYLKVAEVAIVCRAKFILIHGIVVWRHCLHELADLLPSKESVEANLCLSLLTFFGCDDDDTIGTTRTIDSC